MAININHNRSGISPSRRILDELNLLGRTTKNISVGSKTIDGKIYTAVIVKGVPLSSRKFAVSNSDMLFLLPPDYPRFPPIGCYLNFPWDTVGQKDHHFTLQSHYGAPLLKDAGWYWYCVGLGGGFNSNSWLNAWKPGNRPDNGHNLTTLYVTARHAINSAD